MTDCKDAHEWLKELNDTARPLGCRVEYKWWSFHVYKKDSETEVEYYVDGLDSINDIKEFLKSLAEKKGR